MGHTLFKKVWDAHTVATLPTGQTQLFIGLHLVHEVTSPQAFDMLREKGLTVACPDRTFATPDHIVPTKSQARPFADAQADTMLAALERNARESKRWSPIPAHQNADRRITPKAVTIEKATAPISVRFVFGLSTVTAAANG